MKQLVVCDMFGMGTSVDGLVCVPIRPVISGPSIRSPAVWQQEMRLNWTLGANFVNQGAECKEQSSAQRQCWRTFGVFMQTRKWIRKKYFRKMYVDCRFSFTCFMISKIALDGVKIQSILNSQSAVKLQSLDWQWHSPYSMSLPLKSVTKILKRKRRKDKHYTLGKY